MMNKEVLKGGYAADELKRDLISKIKSGALSPGEKLLSERKMAETYKISYMTVRRAIEELVEQGYITREPHRGSFVNEKFCNISATGGQTIAFISQTVYDGVFCELLTAVEKRARQNDYMLLFCNSNMDPTLEKAWVEKILHSNVAGVIIVPVQSDGNKAVVYKLINAGIPVVTIDNIYTDDGIDSVDCNNFDIAYRATEYLLQHGHTNIAHITVSRENFRQNYVAQQRMEGFCKAMSDYNIQVMPGNIQHLPWEYTSLPMNEIELNNLGYEQAMKLLCRENRPTAIFALFDEIAQGIYRAAHEMGINIPQDLSVIGVNNTEFCNRLHPGLTTMAQPFKAIGIRAVDIIVLHNKFQEVKCLKDELPGSLIKRGSVANLNQTN